MMTIAGGVFALQEAAPVKMEPPSFLKGNRLLLANARSCIALLVRSRKPSQVWLPSYLCETMVQASQSETSRIRFYEVNYDLKVASAGWLEEVEAGDLVVFVHYFGFPSEPSFLKGAQARGALVLEDACQAMLSEGIGRVGDYTIYSPRKWVGVPDGGILASHHGDLPTHRLEPPPVLRWLTSLRALVHRRDFDQCARRSDWHALYTEAEHEGFCEPYAMSELSAALLHNCINYSEIARRRCENYCRLSARIASLAWQPELPEGVVPLGFSIRLRNRNRVKEALCEQGIYPPVHWPIAGVVPESFHESHLLSAEMMTLPCDQRLDASDMERIAKAVIGAI